MTRYGMLAFLCLIAVIANVQRSAISVPSKRIQADLHIEKEDMGLIMAVWYWGYGSLQVPAGWLADRWGSRRTLTTIAVIWSLLTGVAGLAGTEWQMLFLWCAMGAAQAGVFPCAAKMIGSWFRNVEHARASGLLGASMALGIALAPRLTGELLAEFSWQQVFMLYVVPGLVWSAAFFLFVPDGPPVVRDELAAKDGTSSIAPAGPSLRSLLSSSFVWLLCGQQFLRAAAMVFFTTWFPQFLQETRRLSERQAADYASWPGIGALFGGLAGGFTSDWILRRTGSWRLARPGVAIVGVSVCAVAFLVARTIADPTMAVLVVSAGAFAATFGGVSGYTVAIESSGRHVATIFSIMNACGNLGAGLFPLIAGFLTGYENGWDVVVYLIAAIFVGDAVLWAFLNPKRRSLRS